jgi:hypothetical protein
MPRRKKTKSKKGGKSKSKKGRASAGKTGAMGGKKMTKTVVVGSGFQSDTEVVKMRYTDEVLLTFGASAGAIGNLVYGINTPRLPCRIIGTETCQGWASQAAKYGKYVCTGSTLHWRATKLIAGAVYGSLNAGNPIGVAATQSTLIHAVVYPVASGSTTSASIRDAAVQKYASRRFEWPMNGGVVPFSSSTPPQEGLSDQNNPRMTWKGSMSMSPSKIDGEPNLRSSNYEAVTSADPTLVPTYVLAFQDIFLDITYEAVYSLEIDMVYDVIFFDRKDFANVLRVGPSLRTLRVPPNCCTSDSKVPSLVLEEKKSSVPDIEALLVEDYRLAPHRAGVVPKSVEGLTTPLPANREGQDKPAKSVYFRIAGYPVL